MNNDTPADAIKALQEDMALISATYLKLTADAESDFKDVDAAMDRVAAWTRTTSLAAQDGLVDALHSAKAFIEAVAENDPDEPIADNGATVWDGLQSSAPKVIAKLDAAIKGDKS